MKRFFLFLFTALLSINMFAGDEPTGNKKADAIPYDWGSGIYVTSEAGVGKWYVVNLKKGMDPAGPFNPNGKTDDGKTDISISVVNPLDQEVNVACTAYMGSNEVNRDFKLAANARKSMTFGAGMFVRMGVDQIFLYLVMDVTVTPEEAATHDAVNVDVQPVEANSVMFDPVQFDWTGIETGAAAGNEIAKNKETWLKIDWDGNLEDGYTFKLYAQNLGSAATTVYGGLAMDCPATNIQEQSKAIAAGATVTKVIDPAMLDMMPGTIYLRLKADQKLHVWAEQVAPVLPAEPLFNVSGAVEVEKDNLYNLGGDDIFKVAYATLKAPEYYFAQVEISNSGSADAELTGYVVKNATGDVFSAVKRTYKLKAGQTIKKQIDNTIMGNLEVGDEVFAKVDGGNSNISFKLTVVPEDPYYCHDAIDLDVPAAGSSVSKDQAAGTKWYAVDITAAKAAKADIELSMTAAEAVDLTVDIAAACAIGEPTQSYTGSSKNTKKTVSYSLFENAGDVIYVRVKANKALSVEAKLITAIVWDGSAWVGGTPDLENNAARIEGDLTINNGEKVEALGLTLAGGKVTIKDGGKLIVGKEGVKDSETADQIIIEEGGVMLIDPACSSNNKPFVTAYKGLDLGEQTAAGHTLPEKHDFIALPVQNRENDPVGLLYANWQYKIGWTPIDGFRNAFVGYNVARRTDIAYCGFIAGQLAPNKNQSLQLPAVGWHAFGNSWLAPIALSDIYSQLSGSDKESAVHFYVASPTTYDGIGTILDNYYLPATAEIASNLNISEIAPMQGFFLFAGEPKSVTLNYNKVFAAAQASAAPAPKRAEADNRNAVAIVIGDGIANDFVYLIEGEATSAHKIIGEKLAIYAEDGWGQIANSNLIGTTLTIKTTEETEYTLNFSWVKGETLVLLDTENGNTIDMTENNTYTFEATPNTISERFQVIGRHDMPTAVEHNTAIEGANKRIENGRVVIIKNGVKFNVLGTQL
jgi:hypothetical protein